MLKYCDVVEVLLRPVYALGCIQTTSIFLTISPKMKKFPPSQEDLKKTLQRSNKGHRMFAKYCCVSGKHCL